MAARAGRRGQWRGRALLRVPPLRAHGAAGTGRFRCGHEGRPV